MSSDGVTGACIVLLAGIAIILIPIIAVSLIAIALANEGGLTGAVWWSFIIVFDMMVLGLLGALSRIGR